MLIQAVERRLYKIINVYSNGDVEVYSVQENVADTDSVIRDTDMAQEMQEMA